MNGVLAQLVALTSYGNNYLAHDYVPVGFYPGNSTFQFCSKVDFIEFHQQLFSKKLKETIVAPGPAEWYKYLKKEGCRKLRLYFQGTKDQSQAPEYKLAGMVGGGGTWYIEAVYKSYSNLWSNRWQVQDANAADGRIWTVNYGRTSWRQKTLNIQVEQGRVKEQLASTLRELIQFALKQNLESWARQFESALALLDSEEPNEQYYHKDLMPLNNYSITARQILFSAGQAWVFGGMGSWNDLSFSNKEDNDLYEKLSGRLYYGIIEAVVSAVNSY